ncbi:DUF2752 domain-containing protein [candidate division KSB1 bacterium]|nr:DUF2752 domain-containing protein [candidate division KSB1 bacterium]
MATGYPCPGCGLGTAIIELLKGHVQRSVQYHVFAPIFVAGFLVMSVMVILPAPQRIKAVKAIYDFEKKTGIVVVILMFLVIYWFVRLAFNIF